MNCNEENEFLKQVPVGAIFQHYRNKKMYKVLSVARHTEDMKLYVVYQELYHCDTYGDLPIWVRPLEMFLEHIEENGKTTPRFLPIEVPVSK
jgi:hypothetical protein